MTEHWPAASCLRTKSKSVVPWTPLAWLVTTTSPIPRTPLHTFQWETFLLQPLHRDPVSFLALPVNFQLWHPGAFFFPLYQGIIPVFTLLLEYTIWHHKKKLLACICSPKSSMEGRIGSGWQYPFYREVNWDSERKPSCLKIYKTKKSHVQLTPVLCSQSHDGSLENTVHGLND